MFTDFNDYYSITSGQNRRFQVYTYPCINTSLRTPPDAGHHRTSLVLKCARINIVLEENCISEAVLQDQFVFHESETA
jgi:hypothetical protein